MGKEKASKKPVKKKVSKAASKKLIPLPGRVEPLSTQQIQQIREQEQEQIQKQKERSLELSPPLKTISTSTRKEVVRYVKEKNGIVFTGGTTEQGVALAWLAGRHKCPAFREPWIIDSNDYRTNGSQTKPERYNQDLMRINKSKFLPPGPLYFPQDKLRVEPLLNIYQDEGRMPVNRVGNEFDTGKELRFINILYVDLVAFDSFANFGELLSVALDLMGYVIKTHEFKPFVMIRIPKSKKNLFNEKKEMQCIIDIKASSAYLRGLRNRGKPRLVEEAKILEIIDPLIEKRRKSAPLGSHPTISFTILVNEAILKFEKFGLKYSKKHNKKVPVYSPGRIKDFLMNRDQGKSIWLQRKKQKQ